MDLVIPGLTRDPVYIVNFYEIASNVDIIVAQCYFSLLYITKMNKK